jgi:tetratricopeptide (TPR) repeat protein
LIRNWRSIWDDDFTPADLQITSKAAFYVLIPPAVALHEFGHAAAVWAYGLHVDDWQFLGYMGWVLPSDSAGPLGDFVIALSGNVVSYLIGLAALLFPIKYPGHPARNVLLFELGRQSMFLVLVFYPLICVVFNGDFRRIYDFQATPIASGMTAAVHAFILAWGYRHWWKKKHQARSMLLCSTLSIPFVALEKRIEENSNDFIALQQMGSLYMMAGNSLLARKFFSQVVEAGAADAKCKLQYASLLAEDRQTAAAIPLLEEIVGKLLRPEDRRLAEMLLIRMNLLGGRRERALTQVETLVHQAPEDPSLLALWAQAMMLNGRGNEARASIEAKLDAASDAERPALRQIFEELR